MASTGHGVFKGVMKCRKNPEEEKEVEGDFGRVCQTRCSFVAFAFERVDWVRREQDWDRFGIETIRIVALEGPGWSIYRRNRCLGLSECCCQSLVERQRVVKR